MSEYRVDDLAREAGTTVRNVRAYQDRGILPPPRRDGRVGWYSEDHLRRLRLISQLLERGYTLGNIAELLATHEQGGLIEDLLGGPLTDNPFRPEVPEDTTIEALEARFGTLTPDAVAKALALGFVEVDGDRVRVTSPRLLRAGEELAAAGVPLDDLLDTLAELRVGVASMAELFVDLVVRNIIDRFGDPLPDPADVPALAEILLRLRPLAESVVDVELTRAVEAQVRASLGERLDRVLNGDG